MSNDKKLNLKPYETKIIADSITEGGVRLTSVVTKFPRFILAEVNTHRVFARNSASSRAIPVKKKLKELKENPVQPLVYGKNKSGMQSAEPLVGDILTKARIAWLDASYYSIRKAEELREAGLHKQHTNRITEPFAWHTAIISATEWDNFFALRSHNDAQPEIHRMSNSILDAMNYSKPDLLSPGDYHLPFIGEEDLEEFLDQDGLDYESLARISCARCARVSYLTHDGARSIEKDFELGRRLLESGHMSPFEHAAVVMEETTGPPFSPQYSMGESGWEVLGYFCGNFRAPWLQYRKQIRNEFCFQPPHPT